MEYLGSRSCSSVRCFPVVNFSCFLIAPELCGFEIHAVHPGSGFLHGGAMGQSCQHQACLHPLILTSFLCLASFCFVSTTPCPADSEDDGESEAAKQLIQPIAEKIIAKYKAKEEEAPLLFFVAGEVSERRAQDCALLGMGTELGWVPLLLLFRE